MNQKPIRIEIDRHSYLAYRDFAVEGITMTRTFDKVLRRLLLADTDKPNDVIGCIVFTLGLLSAYSWETDEDTEYGKEEKREITLANLTPHIPMVIKNLEEQYRLGQKCLICAFEQTGGGFDEKEGIYKIQLKDSFFKTAQKIVFPSGLAKKDVQNEILIILKNHRENFPETAMLLEDLQASIPLTTKSLTYHLGILEEEDKILLSNAPHSDPPKIINIKIKAKGINSLEGEKADSFYNTQVVKQIFGTNIENLTTHGNNSPINVTIGDVETVFDNISKIVGSKEFQDKDEIMAILKDLAKEIKSGKNPKKVKTLSEKIKTKAAWVYNLIFQNPVLTSYLSQILLKTL